jgi:hypothetical protein
VPNTPQAVITLAKISTCPGAKPQRVKVGGKAVVCTKSDRIMIRATPEPSAALVRRLETGTSLSIVDGPECNDKSSWWKIETDDKISGWVREGSDEIDPYYICPTE